MIGEIKKGCITKPFMVLIAQLAGASPLMDRSKYLRLTGLTESSFKTFSHRKLLPFAPAREQPKSWAEYSLRDVLLTDVMLAHMDLGLERVAATSVVRGVAGDLWEALRGPGTALSDVLHGYARFESFPIDSEGAAASLVHQFVCYSNELVSSLESFRGKIPGTFSGFAMVNVSERLDLVVTRARRAGLIEEIEPELEALGRAP